MKKILFCILVISLAACTTSTPSTPGNIPAPAEPALPTETQIPQSSTEEAVMAFEISSPAFKSGEAIPSDFS
ncbi:MAG: hypothetical protein HY863_15255, partial [Chloroflexi bacterium]|nr:hypothetical protein [Chloroflexota bacterium]